MQTKFNPAQEVFYPNLDNTIDNGFIESIRLRVDQEAIYGVSGGWKEFPESQLSTDPQDVMNFLVDQEEDRFNRQMEHLQEEAKRLGITGPEPLEPCGPDCCLAEDDGEEACCAECAEVLAAEAEEDQCDGICCGDPLCPFVCLASDEPEVIEIPVTVTFTWKVC